MLKTMGSLPQQDALLEDAAALLSQQVWCWGQDILRPEGNWLKAVGFERTEPPAERADCPSLYTLTMPGGRTILLRGFGVFYADPRHGCVYLPRYKFRPCFTSCEIMEQPLWSPDDLPMLKEPMPSKLQACSTLLIDLINWIWRYEANVIAHLGVEYRRSTLLEWDNGFRPVIAAEDFARAWCELLVDMEAGA